MAFKVKRSVEGLEEAIKALESVKTAVRTRLLKEAVEEAAQLPLAAARKLVPVDKGLLKKSLGVKIQVRRGGESVTAIMGPQGGHRKTTTSERGATKEVDPVFYAHIVEFGRAAVEVTKKTVLSDGSVIFGTVVEEAPAQPFLRPAWDATKKQVAKMITNKVMAGIEAEAAKAKKGK